MNYKEHNSEELINKLRALLKTALERPLLIEEIAERSVEHDNGFLKIVLQERDTYNYGFRIHKWKPGTSDSNIHTHRWNMFSLILDGGYEAYQYKESTYGEQYYLYDFQPSTQGDYLLSLSKETWLSKILFSTYSKGDSYQLKQGDIHKISKVSSEGALTAIVSWGNTLEGAKVYSAKKISHTQSMQRKLTISEVKLCLAQTLDLIAI